jgi:predicted glycosyltransferase
MRFLFYLGHPAHFHLFRIVIGKLKAAGHEVCILIKKKDILEDLVKRQGWAYTNINPEGRADHKLAIAWKLLKRDFELYRHVRSFRPDVMAGTSAEITHVGRLTGIPSYVFNEDDAEVVPLFARLAYPWATHIVAPDSCSVGKWTSKKISYHGYHELAYLHPAHFTPDSSRIPELDPQHPFFILRFASLTAHHDTGRGGITRDIAQQLVDALRPHGRIFITAERPLEPEFEQYRIKIDPLNIHHALAFATLYIGDSQTMAAEAAVLGTPSIRFNDFVGEISYLRDLEEYGLSYGIRASEEERLMTTVKQLLRDIPGATAAAKSARERLLSDKIDCADFFTRLLTSVVQR